MSLTTEITQNYFKLHTQYTLNNYGTKTSSNLVICCYDEDDNELEIFPNEENKNCFFDVDILEELGVDFKNIADVCKVVDQGADQEKNPGKDLSQETIEARKNIKSYSKNFEYRLILACFLFLKKKNIIEAEKPFQTIGTTWDANLLTHPHFDDQYLIKNNHCVRAEKLAIDKVLKLFSSVQNVRSAFDSYFTRLSHFVGPMVCDYNKKREVKVEFKNDMMLHLKLVVPSRLMLKK